MRRGHFVNCTFGQISIGSSCLSSHTHKTGRRVKPCSVSPPSLLLRSTSCVRLKSAHHVMGLVSRDASAGDGKNESAATPFNELCKMAGETLANDPGYSGSRARRGSVWQQDNDLIMRRGLNNLSSDPFPVFFQPRHGRCLKSVAVRMIWCWPNLLPVQASDVAQ